MTDHAKKRLVIANTNHAPSFIKLIINDNPTKKDIEAGEAEDWNRRIKNYHARERRLPAIKWKVTPPL